MDGNTLDASGNNRHGTAAGGLTDGPGVYGNAAVFDGNQKIDFDEFSINASNYTITGFFATSAAGTDKAIFGLGSTIAGLQVAAAPTTNLALHRSARRWVLQVGFQIPPWDIRAGPSITSRSGSQEPSALFSSMEWRSPVDLDYRNIQWTNRLRHRSERPGKRDQALCGLS